MECSKEMEISPNQVFPTCPIERKQAMKQKISPPNPNRAHILNTEYSPHNNALSHPTWQYTKIRW